MGTVHAGSWVQRMPCWQMDEIGCSTRRGQPFSFSIERTTYTVTQ